MQYIREDQKQLRNELVPVKRALERKEKQTECLKNVLAVTRETHSHLGTIARQKDHIKRSATVQASPAAHCLIQTQLDKSTTNMIGASIQDERKRVLGKTIKNGELNINTNPAVLAGPALDDNAGSLKQSKKRSQRPLHRTRGLTGHQKVPQTSTTRGR